MTSAPPPPPPSPPAFESPKRPANKVARVALIVAVVAFVLGCVPFVGFVSWLIAIAAIVVAIIALTRTGLPKGMAVAGLIIGVIALFVGPSVAIGSVIGAAAPAIEAAASSAAAAASSAPAAVPEDSSTPSDDPASETPEPAPSDTTLPTKSYAGAGDKVVKVDYEAPIVVKFSCAACSDNVSVETDSGTNTLPVNVIGHYTGRFLLNAEDGDLLTKFVIKATGHWKLTITDLQNADLKHVTAGGTLKGSGDDVIAVEDGVSDSDVRNVGSGNFALKSFGGSDSLPVNEIGSYKGNVELDGPAVVQVESDGTWSIKGNG